MGVYCCSLDFVVFLCGFCFELLVGCWFVVFVVWLVCLVNLCWVGSLLLVMFGGLLITLYYCGLVSFDCWLDWCGFIILLVGCLWWLGVFCLVRLVLVWMVALVVLVICGFLRVCAWLGWGLIFVGDLSLWVGYIGFVWFC